MAEKEYGDLRLYADYKDHLNGKFMDQNYSLPEMESNFNNLLGDKLFWQVDLLDASHQIAHADEVKKVCAVNTQQGYSKCVYYLKGWRLFLNLSKLHRERTERNQRRD